MTLLYYLNWLATKRFALRFVGLLILIPTVLTVFFMSQVEADQTVSEVAPIKRSELSPQKALLTHRGELSDLQMRKVRLEGLEKKILDEIEAHDTENTAFSQLLLVSHPRIENLENAIVRYRLAISTLNSRLEMLRKRSEAASNLFEQAGSRIEMVEEQITDIRGTELPQAEKQKLEALALELTRVFEEKKVLGERYRSTYEDLVTRLESALEQKKAFGEKLVIQLNTIAKTSMFRPSNPYRQIVGNMSPEAWSSFMSSFSGFFSIAKWQAHWADIKRGGIQRWAVFTFWLALIIALRARFKTSILKVENEHGEQNWTYRNLGLRLLRRSLLYLGLTLLFGFYCSVKIPLPNIGLGRVLFQIFLTLLISRCGLDYLRYSYSGPPLPVRSFVSLHLKRLIRVLRAIVIAGIVFNWLVGKHNLLTLILQDILAIWFLVWTVNFWRRIQPVVAEGVRIGQSVLNPRWQALFRGWSYLMSGGGLLMDLAGYRLLAGYWYAAWAKTVALLLLGWITLTAIREWYADLKKQRPPDTPQHSLGSAYQVRWAVIQIVQFLWLFGLAGGLLLTWGCSGLLTMRVPALFNRTFAIGNITISFSGIALAVVIVFATHLIVRVGRSLLSEKVLEEKQLASSDESVGNRCAETVTSQ